MSSPIVQLAQILDIHDELTGTNLIVKSPFRLLKEVLDAHDKHINVTSANLSEEFPGDSTAKSPFILLKEALDAHDEMYGQDALVIITE